MDPSTCLQVWRELPSDQPRAPSRGQLEAIMALPCVRGSNWIITRPATHKRYEWAAGGWSFTIRDVGCSWLYRVHARTPRGDLLTLKRDVHTNPSGDGHDGLSPLFGAAHRLAAGKARTSDVWKTDSFAHLYV